MSAPHQTAGTNSSAALPVPHLSFEEFAAIGRRALIRADVPVIIDLPEEVRGLGPDAMAERLGDMQVTLFTEPSSKLNPKRWTSREIQLREFFEDPRYRTDPGTWHRIVSNIRNNPAEVNAILGFDAAKFFDYQRSLNAANLWVSHRGVFTKNHFDELENFNVALFGRKRFVLAPPGFWEDYPRSIAHGYGDKSQVVDLSEADPVRFPKVVSKVAQRRDFILEPGQMLYLPLGWWHQAESLDEVNINMNFWLRDLKIFRRPWVLGVALYTSAYRRVKGVYNYQPAEVSAEGTQ
jgi:hypothetical protein